jgi:mRNA interferase MazF
MQMFYEFKKSNQRKWAVKRGEVYYVDFGENIGSEQNKARPCVVIQANAFNFSAATFIGAIISDSDFGQIKTIAKERILLKIGLLTEEIPDMDNKLLNIFGLNGMINGKNNRISFLEKRIKDLQNELQNCQKDK